MSWQRPLAALVERGYERSPVALDSVSDTFDDRIICRVRFANGPVGLLRAVRGDDRRLLAQATALDWLDDLGFPAPRVIRAASGDRLARHDGWTGLLLTFVDGVVAGPDRATLEALGESAATLHGLPAGPVGPSRLSPSPELLARLPDLEAANCIPDVARSFHRAAVGLLRRLAAGDWPPEALLHGDCWPANAVRAPAGTIVMIDWEQVGRGLAVFEVGYLLLGCHLGLPQLPAMRTAPERIAAVVRGYARRRRPGDAELSWLPDAVRYEIVRRAVVADSFAATEERWREDVWLRKTLARNAVADEVAEIAHACFLRERG